MSLANVELARTLKCIFDNKPEADKIYHLAIDKGATSYAAVVRA